MGNPGSNPGDRTYIHGFSSLPLHYKAAKVKYNVKERADIHEYGRD